MYSSISISLTNRDDIRSVIRHEYENGDVLVVLPTPTVLTPDIRYKMSQEKKRVDLNGDGVLVEFPVIYTHSTFGIRVPGNTEYVRKLKLPYERIKDESALESEDWMKSFDDLSLRKRQREDDSEDESADDEDIFANNLTMCADDSIFQLLSEREEDFMRDRYYEPSYESLVHQGRSNTYDYEEEVMKGYYYNYSIYSEDKKADMVFISPRPSVDRQFVIPLFCMGAEQQYALQGEVTSSGNTGRPDKVNVRRVHHVKLDRYGYWLHKQSNSYIISLLYENV